MKKLQCFLVSLLICTFIMIPCNTVSATVGIGTRVGIDTRLSTPIRGIDVSDHQGDIDWRAVKNSGIQFAMIRCGWNTGIDTDEQDRKFEQNVRNARAAGVKIGTYLYSYAGSVEEARQEAEHCLSLIGKFPKQWFEYPIVFDIEEEGKRWSIPERTGYNRDTMTEMVRAFCTTIEQAGYYASFYANPNWLNNYLHGAKLTERFDLWLAHWGIDSPSRPCGIWQHTDKGRVPGIEGDVDMDYAYYDYPARIRAFHCNGY